MKFGVYYYPWYCPQRWSRPPRHHTPLLGEYDSRDPRIVVGRKGA